MNAENQKEELNSVNQREELNECFNSVGDVYGYSNFGPCLISFQRLMFSQEVLSLLQSEPIFNLQESDLESNGLIKAVDYKQKSNHIYYEGYFHSIPKNSPIPSQHPRFGLMHDKPAASLNITAFCEAIRVKNKLWTEKLKDVLRNTDGIAASTFVNVLADNRHFGGKCINTHGI